MRTLGRAPQMANGDYNGYSWKQREETLKALHRAEKLGMPKRIAPCDMCGDPERPNALHSEDYSEPRTFLPPQTYLLCKACHSRIHKRFNDSKESWQLFLMHLRSGGYGAEFTQRYSVAQRREWQAALADGLPVEMPFIRNRKANADTWWEQLTLDPISQTAAWARPRPLRPRPSLAAFEAVLKGLELSDKEQSLLHCHAASKNHSATMRDLAKRALNSEHPNTANLLYGSLAHRLCEAIPDWKPDTRPDKTPIWMSIVAEGWQPEAGEFEWVLIPQLRGVFGEASGSQTDTRASEPTVLAIGVKDSSGRLTDVPLHEEILKGGDDSALRLRSAQKAVEKMGFTPAQAETLFNVKMTKA